MSEHEYELAPGAIRRAGAGQCRKVRDHHNYTLRTNGAIRHIRSAVGDEPLAYHQGSGGD
jgi:FKBP-type peptidyl-prolyl cis-trans isomerase SlyD